MERNRLALVWGLRIVLIVLLAGCGKASLPNANAVIEKAYKNTADVWSVRYRGTSAYVENSRTMEFVVQGERVLPDRHRIDFRSVERATIGSEQFIIGDKYYIRSGEDQEWQISQLAPEDYRRQLPLYGLEYLRFLVKPERLGDAEIDGVTCLRYRAGVDFGSFLTERMPNLIEGLRDSDRAPEELEELLKKQRDQLSQYTWVLDVWIDEVNYLVRRTELGVTYPDSNGDRPHQSHEVVDFYDFNEPIDIQPPI